MSRLADLVRFYALLDRLEQRVGGTRALANLGSFRDWPNRGVYLFFEISEVRSDSGEGRRVVRVGTHALGEGSRSTLRQRLGQHRGRTSGGAKIATQLEGRQEAIRVEGHTDSVPISTARYSSNWELSGARALRVVRYLITRGVAPDRISAAAYGPYRPIADNGTAEGRARNRRIEIVLVPEDEE